MTEECPACYGKGLTGQDQYPGLKLPADECPVCKGTGQLIVPVQKGEW